MGPQHHAAGPSAGGQAGTPHAPSLDVRVGAVPAGAAQARAALGAALDGRVTAGVLADAVLVVSELVTNSVRHGGLSADATIGVAATLGGGVLRLTVRDAGTGRAGAVARRPPGIGCGYGLHLVERVAERWGSEQAEGTCVWAELRLPAPA